MTTEAKQDEWLWDKFKEFWPPWVEHIENWESYPEQGGIRVHFKDDGYVTSGAIYVFGSKGLSKNGEEQWFLSRIQGPRK